MIGKLAERVTATVQGLMDRTDDAAAQLHQTGTTTRWHSADSGSLSLPHMGIILHNHLACPFSRTHTHAQMLCTPTHARTSAQNHAYTRTHTQTHTLPHSLPLSLPLLIPTAMLQYRMNKNWLFMPLFLELMIGRNGANDEWIYSVLTTSIRPSD